VTNLVYFKVGSIGLIVHASRLGCNLRRRILLVVWVFLRGFNLLPGVEEEYWVLDRPFRLRELCGWCIALIDCQRTVYTRLGNAEGFLYSCQFVLAEVTFKGCEYEVCRMRSDSWSSFSRSLSSVWLRMGLWALVIVDLIARSISNKLKFELDFGVKLLESFSSSVFGASVVLYSDGI
jgi:hypothetical protein